MSRIQAYPDGAHAGNASVCNVFNANTALVIDSRQLRAEVYARALEKWSASRGAIICALKLDDLHSAQNLNTTCRIAILNKGKMSFDSTDVRRVIEHIKAVFPDSPLVVVSENECPNEAVESLRLGASAYIPTTVDFSFLVKALDFVVSGGSYFPRSILTKLLPAGTENLNINTDAQPKKQVSKSHYDDLTEKQRESDTIESPKENRLKGKLTNRQIEVAEQLADGLPNKLIARKLGMTEATVKVHVRQIMQKFKVKNRTQVAIYCQKISIRKAPNQ